MSFPDLPNKQILEIEHKFYRHFSDLIVENIKTPRISETEILQRMELENGELLNRLNSAGKSVCVILGHLGNWEWAVLRMAMDLKVPGFALYKPSSNIRFDRWINRRREKFGIRMIATTEMRQLIHNIKTEPVAIGTLGDQTPVDVDKAHWMTFMRQDTPVFTGTEKLARNYDMAVLYLDIRKTQRGHYRLRLEMITDDPGSMEENMITETHTRLLERSISEQPWIWLWTHRRWKRSHMKKVPFH